MDGQEPQLESQEPRPVYEKIKDRDKWKHDDRFDPKFGPCYPGEQLDVSKPPQWSPPNDEKKRRN